ncbi:DUF4114 domain-containing protein [Anabaena cylindrica FACHB-243]|nr:DUF4114 domain-containing protein [Anabaena cylindrica FACHB-243]
METFFKTNGDATSMTTNAPYIYVSKNLNDIIDADFLRNPFILADVESGSDKLNPNSLQIETPSFLATGFSQNGEVLFQEKTTATFQPSQGLYFDVVTAEQTNNKLDVFEFLIPPEATTVFHSHRQGVEFFYVLGGDPDNDDNPNVEDNDQVEFELNADLDGVFTADPNNPFSIQKDDEIEVNGIKLTTGSFVGLATGKIHTWSNTGKIPARIIALLTPSGIGEGFARVGAPAGLYDTSPEPHPILAANGTNNLVPTGVTLTQVEGLVPNDPQFYDFFKQVEVQPEVLDYLGFNAYPMTIEGVGSHTLYGVKADGSGAFQLSPPDEGPTGLVLGETAGSAVVGDNSPTLDDIVSAPLDPFLGTSYTKPFSLMRFGQNDGSFNPTPMAVNLFTVSAGQGKYSDVTDNYEVFGVLSGQLVFEFGENGNSHRQEVAEGDYIYIEPNNPFDFWASDQLSSSSANLIRFSGLNPTDPRLVVSTTEDDVFRLRGGDSSGKVNLKVTLAEYSSSFVNEIGAFAVDGDDGNIDGIAPGESGYTEAALARAKVLFSAISNSPQGFNQTDVSSLLEFNSGQRVRFFLINNSTLDAVSSGFTSKSEVLFSETYQDIEALTGDEFSLKWNDKSGNSNYKVKINATNESSFQGTTLQGSSAGEVLDFTSATTDVTAEFSIYREAAFNNFVGFYPILDAEGKIDTNNDGQADFSPGDAGYLQAAVNLYLRDIRLTVSNQGEATYQGNFTKGSIFAPFIIANGTPEAVLGNSTNIPAVYFPFLGANPGQADHIRLLGNNVFGFEDLPNGESDNDYNDVIVTVNISVNV